MVNWKYWTEGKTAPSGSSLKGREEAPVTVGEAEM